MLLSELCVSTAQIENSKHLDCYNQLLGKTSYLLVEILERELKVDPNWDRGMWLDDTLIHKVVNGDTEVKLWGVVIWGRIGTTKQWTSPFYCAVSINCKKTELNQLTFLFGDMNTDEIPYEELKSNRSYWDRDFYSNDTWDICEREWEFIVSCETNGTAAS